MLNMSSANQPIRVLHVFNFFNQGGIENFVMNVYRNIDRSKIQFDFAFPINKKGCFDEEVGELGGNIYFFDSEKKSLWNYYKNLSRIIKTHGPYAVVHSHIYYFSGYILLIARLCGVPVRISHSHETLKGRKQTLGRKLYQNIMRYLIKMNATNWLCCSEDAGNVVFKKNIPFQVLYNGIDIKRFLYNEEKRLQIRRGIVPDDGFLVLNVGRFAEQKNHKFIISVFSELVKVRPESHLLLIGAGVLKREIELLIERTGLKDKVTILSNIKNTEDYYSASDVFILPSLYEGMGIVVIEAQASGLPVLISDKVTREVQVTDIIDYLPIENGTERLWVKKLLDIDVPGSIRDKYNKTFEMTPFDVRKTVSDLTTTYLSKSEQ